MEHSNDDDDDDQTLHIYDDSNHWLDNKQEFPDIFETLPTPIRRTRKPGKTLRNLTNERKIDRPLYSTVVKTTCGSVVSIYEDHSFPFQTVAF